MFQRTTSLLAALLLTASACDGGLDSVNSENAGEPATIVVEDGVMTIRATGTFRALQQSNLTKPLPVLIEISRAPGTDSALRARIDLGETSRTREGEAPEVSGLSAALDNYRVWRSGYVSLEANEARADLDASHVDEDPTAYGKGPFPEDDPEDLRGRAAALGIDVDVERTDIGSNGERERVIERLRECAARPVKVDLKMSRVRGLLGLLGTPDSAERAWLEERVFGGSIGGTSDGRETDGLYGTRDLEQAETVLASVYLYCESDTFRAEFAGEVD